MLKEEKEKYKPFYELGAKCTQLNEVADSLNNLNSKYKSALEEINILAKNYCNACDEFKAKTYKNKNDCLYCNYGFIKRKINQVLNDSEC